MQSNTMIQKYYSAGFRLIKTHEKRAMLKSWTEIYTDEKLNKKALEGMKSAQQWGAVLPKWCFVLDYDPRNDQLRDDPQKNSLTRLANTINVNLFDACSFIVRSQSGGLHLYFRKPEELELVAKLKDFDGIDVKRANGYIIGVGSVGYSLYSESMSPMDILSAPDALLELLTVNTVTLSAKSISRVTSEIPSVKNVSQMVRWEADQNTMELLALRQTDQNKMESTSFNGLSNAIIQLGALKAVEGQRDNTTYRAACICFDNHLDDETTLVLLKQWNLTNCSPPRTIEQLRDNITHARKYRRNIDLTNGDEDICLRPNGLPRKDPHNLEIILNKALGIEVRLNLLSLKTEISKAPDWLITPITASGRRQSFKAHDDYQIKNVYLNRIATKIAEMYAGLVFTEAEIYTKLEEIADKHRYHPVVDWLDNLPEWDGVTRINTFFFDYCGTEKRDDESYKEYHKQVAWTIFGGVVQLTLGENNKFDMIPILAGDQGCGKSTLVQALAIKKEWHGDFHLRIVEDKRLAIEATAGKVILEWGELSGMKKGEVEMIKQFTSLEVLEGRLAYQKTPVSKRKDFIIIGSTNEEDVLRDDTGNRRFAIIKVGSNHTKIDLDRVKQDLPQLYAEALYAFDNCVPLKMYIHGRALEYFEECSREAFVVDDFEEVISVIAEHLEKIHGHEGFRIEDIFLSPKAPMEMVRGKPTQKRCGSILRKLGYFRVRITSDGKKERRWKRAGH